jgi:hypothetical protein
MKKSLLLFFAVLFLGLAGCSSKDPKPQTKCLVMKRTSTSGNYIDYTYNGNLLVKQEYKVASGSVYFKIETTYSGTNIVREARIDNQTGGNILVAEFLKEYSGNKIIKTQDSFYDRTTGKLRNQTIKTFTFDNNNNKVKEIVNMTFTNRQGVVSNFESMEEYEYNGKVLVKSTSFSKNKATNLFVKSGFTTYVHDTKGNLLTESNYDNNSQAPHSITKKTYNNENKLLTIKYTLNGLASEYTVSIYEYDAKGNLSLEVEFDEVGNKQYEYKILREYDSKGNVIKSIEVDNNYYDPNLGEYLSSPFTSTTNTYTYEYQCSK